MADRIAVTEIPTASSFAQPSASRTTMHDIVGAEQYDPDPIMQMPMYDPLCHRLVELFSGIQKVRTHIYSGERLTQLAYAYSGNTTTWWMIVAYNGYVHPDEIPLGAVLDIPDFDAIRQKVAKVESVTGRTYIF